MQREGRLFPRNLLLPEMKPEHLPEEELMRQDCFTKGQEDRALFGAWGMVFAGIEKVLAVFFFFRVY